MKKDVNDMILYGHDVMSMLKSNTYSGLKAKLNSTTGKNMSNGTKVVKEMVQSNHWTQKDASYGRRGM